MKKSNIKNHENDVITYTMELQEFTSVQGGWGNAYVAIPLSHPFLNKIKLDVMSESGFTTRKFNVTYDELNEKFPIKGQEWTYSKKESPKESEFEGLEYYVFGFDTLHSWNDEENSSESIICAMISDYADNVVNG